ncbi:MAG: serine hydrolase [Saprospiraceae bacterium]
MHKGVCILGCFFLFLLLSSCNSWRKITYNFSEYKGYKKFDKIDLPGAETPFAFHLGSKEMQTQIASLNVQPNGFNNPNAPNYSLEEYLREETKTTAFLIIQNDSILYEQYFDHFDQDAPLPSFSVAKSFVSALVGIAIQEGKIQSVHDPVTAYLPELLDAAPEWKDLHIQHLLNMRSGIRFDEDSYSNPFGDIINFYISRDHFEWVRKAQFAHPPGTFHYYSSLDTEILGFILERATGKKLAHYLHEKLWLPLGMESDGFWSIDSKKHQAPKAYCCLNASARDYAKLGRLYLNHGNWNGVQILDSSWVHESITPNRINGCYQNQWYSGNRYTKSVKKEGNYEIMRFPDSLLAAEQPLLPTQFIQRDATDSDQWVIRNCGPDFFALGVFGQEVYVMPERNMIFVRLGKKSDPYTNFLFRKVAWALKNS